MKTNKNYFKKVATYLLLVFCITACAQKKEKKNRTMDTVRPIDQLFKGIEPLSYKSKPQYYIEANQSGCYYELFVNGIGVFSHFENVGLANHAVAINDLILESGIQEVTVKLYPLNDIEGAGKSDTLTERSRIKVTIFQRDKSTPWEGLDYKVIKEIKLPLAKDTSGTTVRLAGLPYYEGTFSFKAVVPYKLTGWSESEVLTNQNQEELEKEVVAFYKEYADVIYNQDEAKWVELLKNRELEYLQSVFYNDIDDKKFKARIKELKIPFNSEFKKKEPLEKFKLTFGRDGKIVYLRNIVRKEKSPFSYGVEKEIFGEIKKVRSYEYLFLHKPKGSKKLEIIR